MKNLVIILLIIIIFYEELSTRCFEFFNTVSIKSNIDSREYKVLNLYEDTDKASDTIAELNAFAINLIDKLSQNYIYKPYSPEMDVNEYQKGREVASRLLKNFKSENLQENEPESPSKTSYTKDKSVIALCLREKNSGKNEIHETQVLKFVFLHELAHMVTKELNHSRNFWVNFKFLLEFSENNGLYKTPDFDKTPQKYCSTDISYNPVNDKQLKSYF